MARLAKLTRNLLIVIPAVVTIALLLLLFQQGFGLQPAGAAFQNGYRTASAVVFLSAPADALFRALRSLFSSARASAERRNDSVSATRLS